MMTTDRTAIRRRLAVRRTAHRPPWRGRKSLHRPIVAPLAARVAATLAASVAVGVGVALAKAEHERRSSKDRRKAERQFALLPGEQPADGLRRMALGQLDIALELLGGDDGIPPDERAVHETRKALKRLRALVALAREELGAEVSARETIALREVGRRLSGARDAEVMVCTLDELISRHPRKLGRRGSVLRLQRRLAWERDRAQERALGDVAVRSEVLDELRAIRARIARWRLPDRHGIEGLEPGLKRTYRQGRRRYRRAAGAKANRAIALHEWRKRVKDLRYAAEMLDRQAPERARGKRRRPHGASGTQQMRKLARQADELAETLGEEHDLTVLAGRIGARGGLSAQVRLGRRARKTLLRLIARRRRELRRRALRDGARLYRPAPKRFVARARRAYGRASISQR